MIFETFGKPRKVIKQSGCHCDPVICGRELKYVNMAIQSISLKGSSVPDYHGSPMIVSAIIDYKIIDPLQAAYGIGNVSGYI